jgi:adenine-specific DNA-methyltransferase
MAITNGQEVRAPYTGRLELTWTNKPLCLLAHENGSYEWTPPSDYRVAEVRLLHDVTSVGHVNPKDARAKDNLLIRGDALNALTALTRLQEFSREYVGKVKLCYIDPPFNTKQSFLQYDDALEHSVWLTMIRDRLLQIKELLAPDGSVWLHVDDSEGHRTRSVLDEVFGPDNFVATFIWRKVDSPNDNKVAVTSDHEYIFCYAKSKPQLRFHQMPDPTILEAYGSVAPDGRRYRDRLLKKNGKSSLRTDRPSMFFPITAPDGNEVYPIHDDGREARWSLGQESVQALQTENKLVWKRRVVNGQNGYRTHANGRRKPPPGHGPPFGPTLIPPGRQRRISVSCSQARRYSTHRSPKSCSGAFWKLGPNLGILYSTASLAQEPQRPLGTRWGGAGLP